MTRDRVAMVSQLTEALIEHATLVATQCEGLIRALEATMQRLSAPPPQAQAPQPPASRALRWHAASAPAPTPAPAQRAAPPPGVTAYPGRPAAAEYPSPPERASQSAAQVPPTFEPPPAPAQTQQAQHAQHGGWPGQGVPGPVPSPHSEATVPASQPAPYVPEPQPAAAPPAPPPAGAAAAGVPASGGVPDDAYLRATRLALDGRSREEIAAQISAEYGLPDPEPILNRVLGAT
jgi:hypothetical protein